MANYRIFFTQTASTSVDVEAETFDGAVEAAYNELPRGVCAQCSGMGYGNNSPGIDLSGDWDPDESVYYKDDEYVEVRRKGSTL